MNIVLTSPAITLFNKLIEIKGINIKKLYSLDNKIFKDNILDLQNIYCKNKTNKDYLCLNKCIKNSKYCKIHDPIMKEQRRINQLMTNIRRKKQHENFLEEFKILANIKYDIPKKHKNDILDHLLPFVCFDNDEIMPSVPEYSEIICIDNNPPSYEQKPDECNLMIKNVINNKQLYDIKLTQEIIDNIAESIDKIEIYKLSYYQQVLNYINIDASNIVRNRNEELLKISNIKDDNNNVLPIIKELLPFDDNKIITNIDEYKDKLNKIDFNYISNKYKGIKLYRLYESTIKLEMNILYRSNNKPINSKYFAFIKGFMRRIHK